jgi:hypothetical protein
MNKKQTFEEFLQERHAEHCQNNNTPSTFNTWLVKLQLDTLIKFADGYGLSMYLAGIERTAEVTLGK